MSNVLFAALSALVLIGLVYRAASLFTFTAVVGLVALGFYGLGGLGQTGLVVFAAIYVPVALLLNVAGLRRAVLSAPIFKAFSKALPAMSQTEKDALEAGDTWWEAEMFGGKPEWSKLMNVKFTELTADEKSFLENETEQLCKMVDDWKVSFELKDLPEEVWNFMRKNKFFAMLISKEHGGLGFSPYAQSCVVAKIATRSLTASVTVMVPNSLGPGELIMHYGTDEQKKYWLPRLVDGTEIPCFGLTGPEVGSDASAIPDTGVVVKRKVNGKEELGIMLNFSKRYITLAPVATVVGLAFKLKDPNGLLGDPNKTEYGITCALLEANTPGVEIGRRHYPGAAFMNGPIFGKDVYIPLTSIIGGREMAGKGWRMLVECLSAGRGISLPALSAASGWGMYLATGAYARIRRQFKLPIGKFEGVQEATGKIAGLTYKLEASRILTATACAECAPSVITAMMKFHMTEMMREIILRSMDVHGGRTVILGPRNYLGQAYQAMPVAITVEGANIMTRNLIVFGQGAIRCHPWVLKEMQAAQNPNKAEGLRDFDKAFFGHLGHIVNRAIRALVLGLTGNRLAKSPVSGEMAPYAKAIERRSAALAFTADVAMGVLGGELKRRERLSARLGDVLSHLYMASAVIKYYETNGRNAEELVHAKWALEDSLAEIDKALNEFNRNFPNKAVGRLLSFVAFPFGMGKCKGPSDSLNADAAELLMTRNVFAERLLDKVFVGEGSSDPTGRILEAADKLLSIEPGYSNFLKAVSSGKVVGDGLEAQLKDAVEKRVIDSALAQGIREFEPMRFDAILTDDFSKEYLASAGAIPDVKMNVKPVVEYREAA
ncbi:MAG TPA: acyl-CoA dehydrogenase [Limnobacter sp.]|uniref:acyl-CoA dehydrogenase n=1 Tax=Limnobacter sp. TaxID=2003368 RepID=UPI002E2FC06F|nr:acyl-CoA dehydrogenase [Limnobacter sp.]HEX5486888.1 acyl-CoA dehydrogenase [Limnobacter sp.]